MKIKNNVTFFSPHFDDAIFSSGGTILKYLKQGKNVSVVTIFSGVPNQDSLSDFSLRITYPGWAEERIEENLNALNSIKVEVINLDFLDAIFRKNDLGQDLCLSWDDVFSENKDKHKEEVILYNLIKKNVLEHIHGLADIIYFPLSLGNHIDHILINTIAKELNSIDDKLNIYYYEDLPYANNSININKLLESYLIEKIEEIDINNKISLVSKYKKGLSIGEGYFSTISNIKEHASIISEQGGYFERFWKYRKN